MTEFQVVHTTPYLANKNSDTIVKKIPKACLSVKCSCKKITHITAVTIGYRAVIITTGMAGPLFNAAIKKIHPRPVERPFNKLKYAPLPAVAGLKCKKSKQNRPDKKTPILE